MVLPERVDATAPDGSDVRILLRVGGASVAHFQLAGGETSVATRHRTIDEIWYFLGGRGQMWRRLSGFESIVDVSQGSCISIPVGTEFQFQALGDAPLQAIGTTVPPWPGSGEATIVKGPWKPTVPPGPV